MNMDSLISKMALFMMIEGDTLEATGQQMTDQEITLTKTGNSTKVLADLRSLKMTTTILF